MEKKICIIMADGTAKRMSGLNKKKQLIEIDGEPIIDRTIRQLRALGIEPVIATHYEDFDYLDIEKIIPENNNHEIKKFNANKKYYQDYDEVLFIWGDTYFDDCDIATIINTQVSSYKFFGTHYEIFGFKIKKPYYHLIDVGADYIISHTELDYGNTGTWGLLRHIGGYKLLPNPHYDGGGVTSVHEPVKYVDRGLLYVLPGKSIDNDGRDDLEVLCQRFPDAKVEKLTYTEEDGTVYEFIDKHWIKK